MNWRDYIETRPEVMGGKPVIRDTRISVEIVLEWLAAGWSEQDIFDNYPRLTPAALRAVFAFAREIVAEQLYVVVPKAA